MSSKNDSLERLSGSRLSGNLNLVFKAPIADLQVGGGILASRLDYQRQLENSGIYGSGYYSSIGMNYYMSQRVSIFGIAKQNKENLLRGGGSASVKQIRTNTTSMGLGFSIWL